MIIRLIAPAAIVVLCGATLLQIISPSTPRIIYNPSPSAPVGWYRLNVDTIPETGDLVAAFVPISAADLVVERHYLPPDIPIIKTVWAITGVEICHLDGHVFTPNRPPLSVLSLFSCLFLFVLSLSYLKRRRNYSISFASLRRI